MDDVPAIVIDNGSGVCKGGFAGEDTPRATFNSIVGQVKNENTRLSNTGKIMFVGKEVDDKLDALNLVYPMKYGIVSSWDDIEKVWYHMIDNLLGVAPEDHKILLTEAPFNTKKHRELIAESMFEVFNVPALCIETPALLTLYSTYNETGTVVESGDGVTNILSIHKRCVINESVLRYDFGGRDVTEYLIGLLENKIKSLPLAIAKEVVRDIKEKNCYVASDYRQELKKATPNSEAEKTYKLPNGEIIKVIKERLRCGETLFDPSILCRSIPGIHEMAFKSIMSCDRSIREDLFKNIIISGGNTNFPGFKDRFIKEIKSLAPSDVNIRILKPPVKEVSAWAGGSVLASSSQKIWISKQEYDEIGTSILHKNRL